MMFEDLGLKYIGPVDGHDFETLEAALRKAKDFGGPVIVHAVTRKGNGYSLAENDEVDQMHQTDPIDPVTGKPTRSKGTTWTSVFADELVRIGHDRPDLVAITAAMLRSTGLAPFADAFPERTFDVGIAEQHAVTSAAGLAMAGMHPVVAIYATFLNRAFDQVLMDVALHKQPVTFVLDRAGITGPDGASHHGMWDTSILSTVPGIRIAAPRDAGSLREELREAVAVDDGPTVLRFPKAAVGPDIEALERIGTVDVLRRPADGESADVLLVAVGAFAELALSAADRLADQGIGVTVVDPRWIVPVPQALTELAARHKLVVTVEDGGRHGESRLGALGRAARRRCGRSAARSRYPATVPRARLAARGAGQARPDGAGRGAAGSPSGRRAGSASRPPRCGKRTPPNPINTDPAAVAP